MEMSEATDKIFAAFAAASPELPGAEKAGHNPHLKVDYATLGGYLAAFRPVLARHGLALLQPLGGDGERLYVHTMLVHQSGQWVRETTSWAPHRGGQKCTAQELGAWVTYLRKYSLSAMLSMAAADDDAASVSQTPPRSAEPQRAEPAPNDADQHPRTRAELVERAKAILEERYGSVPQAKKGEVLRAFFGTSKWSDVERMDEAKLSSALSLIETKEWTPAKHDANTAAMSADLGF